MRTLFLIFILYAGLMLFNAKPAYSESGLALTLHSDSSLSVGRFTKYAHSESKVNWKEAQRLLEKQSYLNADIPNIGYRKGEHWFGFSIQVRESGRYFLAYEYPLMQRIKIYQLSKGEIVTEKAGGRQTPLVAREVESRNHIFAFDFAEGQHFDFLISLETTIAVNFPLRIYSEKAFAAASSKDYFNFGLYFGLMAALVVYNCFLFLSIGQTSYILYSGYLSAIGFVHFFLFGFANQLESRDFVLGLRVKARLSLHKGA